jgi:hypothetical protein
LSIVIGWYARQTIHANHSDKGHCKKQTGSCMCGGGSVARARWAVLTALNAARQPCGADVGLGAVHD